MSVSFTDPDGTEVPAVTEAEMREVDRVAIEETGPNLFQMMENAGRSLALTALDMRPRESRGPVVVLAGTGGNGGGGITAARHLANRGVEVLVVVTDQSRLREVPAFQLHVFEQTGSGAVPLDAVESVEPTLVIDAVIGYSLSGPPGGAAVEMIEWARTQPAPVLSLDTPSGINATTGDTPGAHIEAAVTMTLALPKYGLGNPVAGDIILADIGIPIDTYRRANVPLTRSPFSDGFRVPLIRAETS